jgi:hypothetical protein
MRFAAVHESVVGRYCCKSPKWPGANFPAVKKSDRRPRIDVASITLPRSPASLSSRNKAPHIFTRKSCVQSKEILITSAKRLLQQNLHKHDRSFISCASSLAVLTQCVRCARTTRTLRSHRHARHPTISSSDNARGDPIWPKSVWNGGYAPFSRLTSLVTAL